MLKKYIQSLVRDLVEEEIQRQIVYLPLAEEIKMTIPKSSKSDFQEFFIFLANVDNVDRLSINVDYTTTLGTLEEFKNKINGVSGLLQFLEDFENKALKDDISHFRGIGCHVGGNKGKENYKAYFNILSHGRWSEDTVREWLKKLKTELTNKFPEYCI